MNTCVRCGGKIVDREVELIHRWGDRWYIFRNVPAHVCEECGEEYFDADVLKRIDEMRETADDSEERIEVPAVDFSRTDKAA